VGAGEKEQLGPWKTQAVIMRYLLGVTGFKLNPDFARYLLEHHATVTKAHRAPLLYPHHASKRSVRERLGEQNIADLVAAFKAGVPKQVLANRYGINLKSVKQLLQDAGVKKRSRYERLA
jgi:hypothetical protein